MPIRIPHVYTRTGDDGTTALVGGKHLPKDASRIAASETLAVEGNIKPLFTAHPPEPLSPPLPAAGEPQ